MPINIPGVDEDLLRQPYYHGLLPREDVPELLRKNGEFLIRITEPSAGMAQSVVISVMWDEDQPASTGVSFLYILSPQSLLFRSNTT